jgi:hypothetical protein
VAIQVRIPSIASLPSGARNDGTAMTHFFDSGR